MIRPENPELFARVYDADGKPVRERPTKPADLIAAVRAAVESGTIEGEVVWWCENHDSSGNPERCEFNMRQGTGPACRMVDAMVVVGPLVERGEGGNK